MGTDAQCCGVSRRQPQHALPAATGPSVWPVTAAGGQGARGALSEAPGDDDDSDSIMDASTGARAGSTRLTMPLCTHRRNTHIDIYYYYYYVLCVCVCVCHALSSNARTLLLGSHCAGGAMLCGIDDGEWSVSESDTDSAHTSDGEAAAGHASAATRLRRPLARHLPPPPPRACSSISMPSLTLWISFVVNL